MYVSDHFHINEVGKSQAAVRHHINNTPPRALYDNIEIIAHNILEPIRDEYGEPFSPQSWYRAPKLNQLIGGSPNSFHLSALAVDIELLGWDNEDFAYWAAEYLDFDKIILEYYNKNDSRSGWVHIQLQENVENNRREFLSFDGKQYERLS